MIASTRSQCPVLALIAMTCLAAQPNRPAPNFAGKSIPDPPRQKEPWTPPQTKLPRFLASATAALFEQGMADPRGCEYREVEVGDGAIIKTRGFVLPERTGEAGRFVVTWDGVAYPASSVGAAADLDKDIRALAQSMKRDRESAAAGNVNRYGNAGGFSFYYARGGRFGRGGPSGADGRSPLKLCLLLRLGRADLAEALFAAGTTWTPEVPARDLTDYHISYLSLARDWAAAVFVRLVDAHMRGDDAIALDAAGRLSAFARAVETKAEAMGFERGQQRAGEAPSYLPFLGQLPELLVDQERRAREPARGPISRRGADPSARIAALIRELDQIGAQAIVNGAASPAGSPLVKMLIAEGDPAVEPLLAALESDMRLTRTVSHGRGMSIDRFVSPVFEAELAALRGILQTSEFFDSRHRLRSGDLAARKELARSIRARWIKDRAISLNERWYRMLRDDAAGRERWAEAAGRIIQPNDSAGPVPIGRSTLRDQAGTSPMKGEDLRSRRDPSISELLARRANDIARSADGFALNHACSLSLALVRWDEKAAMPVVRTMMTRCLEEIDSNRGRNAGVNLDEPISSYLAAFTLIRTRAGDHAALDEYAGWAGKTRPDELKYRTNDCLEPMWRYPDEPAMREAARWLFNDPQSPWVPLLRAPGSDTNLLFHHTRLYASPLLCTAGFREGLLAATAIKTEMGTVGRGPSRTIEYKTGRGWGESFQANQEDLDSLKPGVTLPFRVCDFIAWKVSAIEGSPRCELFWPQDRRDRALDACAAFLNKYGDRFTGNAPEGAHDFPDKLAHLAFPTPERPATLEDVRAARAIFSLEGRGRVHVVNVPAFPIKARWVTLKDTPVDRQRADGTTFREFDQDGWIWQAEEVRADKGDRWKRYFGFVGHHVIERVPASEVELARDRFMWGPLPGGLDARIEPVEPRRDAFEAGKPIPMTVRIRNRRGVENAAPTEFLRRGGDGRPSLRRGVSLALYSSDLGPSRGGQRAGIPSAELKPKPTDHFDPGQTTRPLGPFEVFDAMQLDLNDWFDLARPGSYRVHVSFAADSGVGEGSSNDRYFTVGEREARVP